MPKGLNIRARSSTIKLKQGHMLHTLRDEVTILVPVAQIATETVIYPRGSGVEQEHTTETWDPKRGWMFVGEGTIKPLGSDIALVVTRITEEKEPESVASVVEGQD
jgi:hypothetical protein